jgi:hypothetical protein
MNNAKTYRGRCFCGSVRLTARGAPVGMGFFRSDPCARGSPGPVAAYTLWKAEAVRITRGAGNIGTYSKSPNACRKWCKTCGGHLFTEHPGWGLVDVYAEVFAEGSASARPDIEMRPIGKIRRNPRHGGNGDRGQDF